MRISDVGSYLINILEHAARAEVTMQMQEYLAAIRAMMDEHNVAFQTAELGKIDVGGGGTIAYITALYGMEVIDSGVAVLNMHAPLR